VVAEVENIGPGISRDMSADLAPGTYEVACKPGQTGDGIRAPLTVTGDASAATAAAAAAREITLGIDASDALSGTEGQSASVGETVEFVVTNEAAAERVFEVKRPDGSVAGETEIAAGATGELTVDTGVAGDWLLIVEGGATETETVFTVS
jgi:iron uptake system component EfeO